MFCVICTGFKVRLHLQFLLQQLDIFFVAAKAHRVSRKFEPLQHHGDNSLENSSEFAPGLILTLP